MRDSSKNSLIARTIWGAYALGELPSRTDSTVKARRGGIRVSPVTISLRRVLGATAFVGSLYGG